MVKFTWEDEKDAFERCVRNGLLDNYEGVMYRKGKGVVIDLKDVSYFENDAEFNRYRTEKINKLPSWVLRSKNLHSFNRTLQYIVAFLRRIEVYGMTGEILTTYDDKTKK